MTVSFNRVYEILFIAYYKINKVHKLWIGISLNAFSCRRQLSDEIGVVQSCPTINVFLEKQLSC